MDEEVRCFETHAMFVGVSCLKIPNHAGTHAWRGYMQDRVYTFITWGRSPE